MSAENFVPPGALEMNMAGRVLGHLTYHNIDRLGDNAAKAGVIAAMGEIVTDRLTEHGLDRVGQNALDANIVGRNETAPWSAYMAIMDSVTASESERIKNVDSSNPLHLTRTVIRFDGASGRDRAHHLIESVLAGIPSQNMPRIRTAGRQELLVHGMAYADIATLGRLGTALLRRQYKSLGGNLRGLTQTSLQDVIDGGLLDRLPELKERVVRQKEVLGGDTLLSSGNISVIGRSLRGALVPTEAESAIAQEQDKKEKLLDQLLLIQRARDDRPFIEDGTRFVSGGEVIPLSHTTVGATIKEQVAWKKVVQDIWGLATGLGANHGLRSVAKTGGRILTAVAASTRDKVSDRKALREARHRRAIEGPDARES